MMNWFMFNNPTGLICLRQAVNQIDLYHYKNVSNWNKYTIVFSFSTYSTSGISLPQEYYMPDEDDERPFICSLPVDNGIMSCTDVPARREGGRACCLDKDDVLYRQSLGLSPEPLTNGSISVAGLCVNWNQYYTRCHTGSRNPHKDAINFDNIAYAWIVIFQVCNSVPTINHRKINIGSKHFVRCFICLFLSHLLDMNILMGLFNKWVI